MRRPKKPKRPSPHPMRLLRTDDYSLKEFSENDLPSYVILSHTWGSDEVTFADLRESGALGRIKKSRKIVGCCKQARQDGYEWVWIDTCNIDKSSSAELSEAINSMYRWYEGAHICYAYLADVDITRSTSLDDQISGSRWMTRAWTLQELIGEQTFLTVLSQSLQAGHALYSMTYARSCSQYRPKVRCSRSLFSYKISTWCYMLPGAQCRSDHISAGDCRVL